MSKWIRPTLGVLTCVVTSALVTGCSGGGGGGSQSFADVATLESITFPMQADPTSPPSEAPLNQQVVFTFNLRNLTKDSGIAVTNLNGFLTHNYLQGKFRLIFLRD